MSVSKIAAWVPVSREVLIDAGVVGTREVPDGDRWRKLWNASRWSGGASGWFGESAAPWEYWDRPAMPSLDLFPGLTRWTERARELRQRIRDVVGVARHGMPEHDEDRW